MVGVRMLLVLGWPVRSVRAGSVGSSWFGRLELVCASFWGALACARLLENDVREGLLRSGEVAAVVSVDGQGVHIQARDVCALGRPIGLVDEQARHALFPVPAAAWFLAKQAFERRFCRSTMTL